MPCRCSQLPEIVRLDDYPSIAKDSDELESGGWLRLVRCRSCGQLWSLDEWDKYQTQFAIKISQRDGWRQFDTTPLRREFLIRARGGLTDEICIRTGCSGRRVRGVVYCADHLYETGARE
jgi:hypothetical protein